jgi:hypothetical protein
MATKLTVPRPATSKKVQPKEKEKPKESSFLDAAEVLDEPSAPPSILPGIPIGVPAFAAEPPPPPPTPSKREVVMSLPSQYELDSERKSSPPIAERRKLLATYVATAVGVAWFICTCAVGETAARSFIASMH